MAEQATTMIAYRGIVDIYGRIELASLLLRLRRVLGPPSGHFERVIEWFVSACVSFDPVLEQRIAKVSLNCNARSCALKYSIVIALYQRIRSFLVSRVFLKEYNGVV
jgi:hypothetical protein